MRRSPLLSTETAHAHLFSGVCGATVRFSFIWVGRFFMHGCVSPDPRASGLESSARPSTVFPHCAQVFTVAFSLGSGQYVATASDDQTARVWPLMGGPPLAELRGHNGAVFDVALSGQNSCAVTGSADSTVCVWDWSAERAPVSVLRGHRNHVISVQLSLDNTKAFCAPPLCCFV